MAFPVMVLAQQTPSVALHAQFDQTGRAPSLLSVPTFDTRYEGILGSRYTVEIYNEGELWLTDNRHYTKELKYRFDEMENSIQIQLPEGKEILLFNNQVNKAQIRYKDSIFNYVKAKIPTEKEVHQLYQVLFEGKNYQLLKLPTRKLKRIDEKSALTIGRLYDQITPYFHYFIKIGINDFTEIKFKKKDIIKTIPLKRAQLEQLLETPQYKGDLDESKIISLIQTLDNEM